MGLLDSIAGAVGQQLGGGQNGVMNMVTALIANQGNGGLAGLLQQFQAKGLGAAAASWVGTGENQPISGDQLSEVLGSGTVQQLAARAGLDPNALAGQLAHLLPQAIDKLTPGGSVPRQDAVEQNLGSVLKGLFGGG